MKHFDQMFCSDFCGRIALLYVVLLFCQVAATLSYETDGLLRSFMGIW